MFDSYIFHIDVNSAYLSWEAAYRIHHQGYSEDLRLLPSAVAGDTTLRRGIILAKSLPAKRYGVRTGECIFQAKQKCPDLLLVPPNYTLYQRCSVAMINLIKTYSPAVEPYSIDEVFADMTGVHLNTGNLSPQKAILTYAKHLQTAIQNELGFTVNIGISSNKLLAKMASNLQKPNKIHTLFSHEISEKLWPLPISDLFFCGPSHTKKLYTLGIRTIGELANTDPFFLRQHLKKHGDLLWNFANGRDFSLVSPTLLPQKGYGNSTTLPRDITDPKQAFLVLLSLCETIGTRLRNDHVQAGVLSLSIKNDDFFCSSRQATLSTPTNLTTKLYESSCFLFHHLWNHRPIRHIGIQTKNILPVSFGYQLSFPDPSHMQKLDTWDKTVDSIRRRFGTDSLIRCCFLNQPQDHMGGGISREKWKQL